MRLNLPKKVTFYVSVALAVLGLLAFLGLFLQGFAFWFLLAGYVLLAAGLFVKGL